MHVSYAYVLKVLEMMSGVTIGLLTVNINITNSIANFTLEWDE